MPSKQSLAATAAALGGLMAVGGATYAFADGSTPSTSPTTSPSAGSSSAPAQRGSDTPVTGTIADAVKAAVKVKDSSVTISTVQQDADGSYDALGTKSDGTRVQYDVSKDYKTVTLMTNGGKGARDQGTAVTGTTLTSVKDAITAKYSGVTVTDVRQASDGSYHAVGTKGTTRVFFAVSKDLKTVTEQTAPAGGHAGARGTEVTGTTLTAVKNAVTAKYSGVTVTDVRQDTDGSYHVAATKGSTRVFYTVSKDLKTVTQQTAPAGGQRGQQPGSSSSPSASASASTGA